MRAYPPGTVCVVVRTHANMPHIKLGDLLTCAPGVHHAEGKWCEITPFGELWQHVHEHTCASSQQCYPISWMRPLDEDTDESDREVIESYKARGRVLDDLAA